MGMNLVGSEKVSHDWCVLGTEMSLRISGKEKETDTHTTKPIYIYRRIYFVLINTN